MRVKGTTSELAKKQRRSSQQQQQNATNTHSNNRKSSVNSDNDDDDGVNNGGGNNNINGKACIHLSKAINNLSQLRKSIKQQPIGECTSCNELKRKNNTEPKSSTTTTTTDQGDSSHQPSIWMCLSCGHQGCDRSSEAQHALKHFQTPRSTVHCICLNLDSWSFWCYECDEEICVNGKKIDEVISFVKKAAQQQQQQQQSQSNQNNDRSSSIERVETVRYFIQQPQQQQQNKKQQQQQAQGNNASVQSSSGHQKVAGLHNLGNTCFFNAVLQNLAQTPGLDSLLQDNTNNGNKQEMLQLNNDNESDASELSDNEEQDTNNNNKNKRHKQTNSNNKSEQLVISINEAGSMTNSFYYLLKEMNSSRSNVSPGGLFGLVCKKVPSFKGYQQQDSHELLRHLLDAIKAEEIKRRQSGILSALSVNSKCVDDSTKLKIKNYGRLINYTFIDSLFGGHLLSTIVCEQCKTCSQNIEPFLDLSLPIVDDKTVHNILTNPNKIAKSNDNVSLYIDDPRDNPGYVSKNQLKKQKKQSKKVGKTKTKQPQSTTVGATNNQSDDEQDDIDDENNNNTTVNEQPDDNVSNEQQQQQQTTKSSDECSLNTIEKSLNDCVDNAIPNSWKLEAMQSLSRRTPTLLSSESEQSDNANPCSLQSCLLKFTSPELLTGNNKFGCETCTRNYYRKLASSNASKDNNSQKTIYTQALKQYLICELPAVLTVHLKRFQQHGFRLEKVNKFVNFPLELDMSPYTSKLCTNINSSQRILYSLFGVVEHSGRLNGGHYTAYVKVKHQKQQQQQNIEKFLVKKKLQTLYANTLKQQQLNGGSNPSISTSIEDATCAAIVEANNELNATSSSSSQQPSSSSTSLLSNNPTSPSTWYYISDSHVSEVSESKILKLQAYILFYERIA